MNLLKIFTKIISFFNWDASGWYPIVIDQFDKMKLISYGQFDFTYDIKEGNVIGFKIPYMCDKIRFNCSSNVSFTATTFKNYSSENCETHSVYLFDLNPQSRLLLNPSLRVSTNASIKSGV